jgi:hypothetical protein
VPEDEGLFFGRLPEIESGRGQPHSKTLARHGEAFGVRQSSGAVPSARRNKQILFHFLLRALQALFSSGTFG